MPVVGLVDSQGVYRSEVLERYARMVDSVSRIKAGPRHHLNTNPTDATVSGDVTKIMIRWGDWWPSTFCCKISFISSAEKS